MLVERGRVEAVKTGQIDEIRLFPVQRPRPAFTFDSDAGIICYFLFETGEGVKKSRLSGIRIAGKSYCDLRIMSVFTHSSAIGPHS